MNIPLLDLKAQYNTIKNEISIAVNEVIESQQFILGPQIRELEKKFAAYSNTQYAVGVASGTDALLLSLMACNVGPDDEVITTPYTFFATAGSISRLGAKPVFVDIDERTYNINPELIERKITEKTKAILPVHLYGQCADMDPILEIASKHNLFVIEDACQAVGAEYKSKRAGSIGDFGCFSFFPSKNLGGFGDGGMITTNNPELAEKAGKLRVHGCSNKYYHDLIGTNSRLDTLQAAVILVKMNYIDQWTDARRKHAQIYNEAFSEAPDIVTPFVQENSKHVYNQYMISSSSSRDSIMNSLKGKQIGCALYYPLPLHLQKCYESLGYKEGDLPVSETAAKETLSIPVYPELDTTAQERVIKVISEVINK